MFAALLLALPLPVQASASSAPVLAADAEARWIPFELTPGNQIRFEMTLNGAPVSAILDTGVTDSFVTARVADRLGLRIARREQATAIGGGVEIGWTEGARLAMGALSRGPAPIAVTGADALDRFGADLFIGADMVACCALDIDYDARRFRILPSGRLPFAGSAAPLTRASTGLFRTQVSLNGVRLRPIVVDTGDGAQLTLGRAAWAMADLPDAPLTTTLGWGMGGEAVTDMAIVDGPELAGTSVRETEVRIEPPAGFNSRTGSAGRIGSGLLLRFRVLIDARAGRMVLQPGKRFGGRVGRSTSGLLMTHVPGALQVLHVMANSPAAEAGWRAGERICAADGEEVPQRAAEAANIDWGAGAPGRTVRITLCGGETRTLTLRRFY